MCTIGSCYDSYFTSKDSSALPPAQLLSRVLNPGLPWELCTFCMAQGWAPTALQVHCRCLLLPVQLVRWGAGILKLLVNFLVKDKMHILYFVFKTWDNLHPDKNIPALLVSWESSRVIVCSSTSDRSDFCLFWHLSLLISFHCRDLHAGIRFSLLHLIYRFFSYQFSLLLCSMNVR